MTLKGRDTPLHTSKKMRWVAVRTGVSGPQELARTGGTSTLVDPCGESKSACDLSSIGGSISKCETHAGVSETSGGSVCNVSSMSQ